MSKQARKEYTKIVSKKKRKIARRLKRKQWEEQKRPMFTAKNIHYEIAEKERSTFIVVDWVITFLSRMKNMLWLNNIMLKIILTFLTRIGRNTEIY